MYINKLSFITCFLLILVTISSGNRNLGSIFSEAAKVKNDKFKNKSPSKSKNTIIKRDSDNYGFVKGLVKVNIYGNLHEVAYYYAYIGMGNPKLKQMLIIDTGSQLVNVACGNCPGCGKHLLRNYTIENSVTHRLMDCKDEMCKIIDGKCNTDESCAFNETYSEGSSVEGKYVGDLISFDTTKDNSDLVTFFDYIGCINKESDLIKSQLTNGILGLSKSEKPTIRDDEYYETQSFIEKYLTDHFRPTKKIFSLCLSDIGGVMTLGGHDKNLDLKINNVSKVSWAPLTRSEFYVVRIFDIKFQDVKLEYKLKNFVLDTGTTISTVDSSLFNGIYNGFKKICDENTELSKSKRAVGKCTVDTKTRKICFSDISKLPPIVLMFNNGSKFEWTSESYMIDRTNKKTVNDYNWWCLGIEESKTKENILGATFFKNNHIIFDLRKNRIGLSIGKCPENRD